MGHLHRIAVCSDIHYAGYRERQRGPYYLAGIRSPLGRWILRAHRHFIWMRDAFAHNHLLDEFLAQIGAPDYVVANGDYSCDTGFVGVSDDAACESAQECLQKIRQKFATNFMTTIGDHELGKLSLGGGQGGMRVTSWHRAVNELGLQPLGRIELGRYVLIGIASSLVGYPVYEPETLREERDAWQRLREIHLQDIRRTFAALDSNQRVILVCHDPSALSFLWREEMVRSKLDQVEQTIIGHLHSNLVFRRSRWLAGMPTIRFLGHTPRRLSSALNQARFWKPFRVRLCPSLAGLEIERGGGFYTIELDAAGDRPARFELHRLTRK